MVDRQRRPDGTALDHFGVTGRGARSFGDRPTRMPGSPRSGPRDAIRRDRVSGRCGLTYRQEIDGIDEEPDDDECPNCGNDLDGDEAFCPQCGIELEQRADFTDAQKAALGKVGKAVKRAVLLPNEDSDDIRLRLELERVRAIG